MTSVKSLMPNRISQITYREFEQIQRLVYDRMGINLSEKKRSLMVGRLQKLVGEHGFHDFGEYYNHLICDKSGKALSELADRISTNHTYFYRENSHFDYFSNTVLPEISSKLGKDRDLRIWCAGSSSGEEPYTLVMLMMEFFGGDYSKWNAGLLATDISDRVLSIAKRGVYPAENVEKLPKNWQQKYFKKRGDEYAVVDAVKKEVVYRRFNLMNKRFPFKKSFHVIFCRNVM
ncbi:MAG: protein-glutamate O-methyltransferase CheR, partial [Planctomycetes bacterium]|nr:protein-glutamate O-methyltransferase CheR [Planctomycetota bacterium]